jgi:hypothetical protein
MAINIGVSSINECRHQINSNTNVIQKLKYWRNNVNESGGGNADRRNDC